MKKVENIDVEKLEFVKKHMNLEQDKDVINALISEKCDNINRIQEEQRKQKITEAETMKYLGEGEYSCPM